MKTFIITFLMMAGFIINGFSQNCHNFWVVVSPDGNYLYFSSDRLGAGYDIYRCDIDGSDLLLLANLPGNDLYPGVSPDGSTIVFQNGNYGGAAEIYKMNNDGTNLVRLTNNSVYDGYPNFSPDGQKIVFSAWDLSSYPEIFIMDADGGNRTQLTELTGASWQSAPKFNPAGNKIYFQASVNANDHLVTIDIDGGNWVDISPENTFGIAEANLFFNPDGTKIIFFNTDRQGYNNGSDIVVANADGTDWVYVTNAATGQSYYQACYHPTNNLLYLTYMSSPSGYWNIYSMNQDGTNMQALANCSAASVDEISGLNLLKLFPSPGKGTLSVKFPVTNAAARVCIYNAMGGLIMEQQWPQGKHEGDLHLDQLGNGVYLCEVFDGKHLLNKKFIINK